MEENILCILVHFLKFENGNSNRNVTCPNDTYCTTWWKHMMKSSAAGVTSSQLTDSLHSLMENVITDSPCPGADGNELSRTHLWIDLETARKDVHDFSPVPKAQAENVTQGFSPKSHFIYPVLSVHLFCQSIQKCHVSVSAFVCPCDVERQARYSRLT